MRVVLLRDCDGIRNGEGGRVKEWRESKVAEILNWVEAWGLVSGKRTGLNA